MLSPPSWVRRVARAAGEALGLGERRCAACLRPFLPGADGGRLCPACRSALAAYAGPRCPRCGLPPSAPGDAGVCGACLRNPPPWSGLACHGLYAGALRDVLLRLKFDGHIYLAPVLGGFLLESAACLPLPDAVLAVPQHPSHLRRRGYNQAHELARALCHASGLPLIPGLLARPVSVPAQSGLDAAARRANARGAFAASARARGLRVWLVDDILTTGSTLAAAARALLDAGAARVDALFVARTPRRG